MLYGKIVLISFQREENGETMKKFVSYVREGELKCTYRRQAGRK